MSEPTPKTTRTESPLLVRCTHENFNQLVPIPTFLYDGNLVFTCRDCDQIINKNDQDDRDFLTRLHEFRLAKMTYPN